MEDTSRMNFEQVPYEEIRNTLKEFMGVFRDRLSKKTRLKADPMRIEADPMRIELRGHSH